MISLRVAQRLTLARLGSNEEARRQTNAYLEARWDLAQAYIEVANVVQIKDIYEKTLFHILELQRLDAYSPLDVRKWTPFIVFNHLRDNDAFDFIRY